MAIGIIGIIVALVIFLYGAYKNVSTLYLAPACAFIVAVTNMINPTVAFTDFYVGSVQTNAATGQPEMVGIVSMIVSVFPMIFLGGIFGKVLTDSGAATSIASTLVNKFVMPVENRIKQAKRAVLIMLIIEVVLTYGGVDGFVAVFATFPIALFMAEKIGIPRRLVPAMLVLSCGANSAPFVLSINNILCMNILGTNSGAAAIPGFISFVIIEVGVYLICSTFIVKAIKKNETFDRGPCPAIRAEDPNVKKPHFVVSLIPLILVFLLFLIAQNASLALCVGIISTIVLMSQYFQANEENHNPVGRWVGKIINSLNDGAVNAAQSVMIIVAASGFAAVVQQTEAFSAMVGKLMSLPFPPLLIAIIMVIIVVAFTSSPPAALAVVLPIIASAFIWPQLEQGLAPLINPDALARTSAIAVSTFETLPVNGLILLTNGLACIKIKDGYLPQFLMTVIMTLVGTFICLALCLIAPGIV